MALSKYTNIEDLIRAYVPFSRGMSGQGWNVVYCEYCGDGSRTKGPRGGWLFQDDMAFYNCFNCQVEASYDPHRKYPLSKNMGEILEAFNIPPKEYKLLAIQNKQDSGNYEKKPEVKHNPLIEIPVPSHFYLLSEAPENDPVADYAIHYLKARKIDPAKYPFYLSTGLAKESEGPKAVLHAKSLKNRLIIPAFRGDKMIYYQARDMGGKAKHKYVSPEIPRSNVLYGYDRLYEDIKAPLFITEGFFDSYHLNGVAVMENKLSSQQVEVLKRSPRKKVIVPDRNGDSKRLGEDALEAGFGISIPNWGGEKDVSAAVLRYGRLYVAKSIVDSIKFGIAARGALKMMK